MAMVRMKAAEVREYGPLWRDSRVGYPRSEKNLILVALARKSR